MGIRNVEELHYKGSSFSEEDYDPKTDDPPEDHHHQGDEDPPDLGPEED